VPHAAVGVIDKSALRKDLVAAIQLAARGGLLTLVRRPTPSTLGPSARSLRDCTRDGARSSGNPVIRKKDRRPKSWLPEFRRGGFRAAKNPVCHGRNCGTPGSAGL